MQGTNQIDKFTAVSIDFNILIFTTFFVKLQPHKIPELPVFTIALKNDVIYNNKGSKDKTFIC